MNSMAGLEAEQPAPAIQDTAKPAVVPAVVEESANIAAGSAAAPSPKDATATDTTTVPADAATPAADAEKQTAPETDYEAFYKRLTQPFKANGKDFVITNPDDMITLMQKGTDYVKKMTELKPLRRIGKLLDEHQLTEADLAYLIDLKHKKPEAIAKLLKDSAVDPYSFDLEQGKNYAPVAPVVSEVDDALQSTLDELQATSATFAKTINVVGKQWDVQSREIIAQHPHLLKILDTQVANGAFDKINSVMEYERAMGRLTGLSDIQAYTEIERRLQGAAASQTTAPVQPPVVAQQPVQTPQQQQRSVEQRKQAASPRQTTVETPVQINSPVLSDEEFLKQLAQLGIR